MKKTFFVPLLALVLFAGIAQAQTNKQPQAGLVPGNLFYILDVMSEGVGNFFTFSDVSKAERYLNQATERLAEARELAANGKLDRAVATTNKYEKKLAMAIEKAEKAKADGNDTDAVLQKIADATSKHGTVLAEVLAKVPEQAKKAIQNAMMKSQKGHDTALEAVGGTKETRPQNENAPTSADNAPPGSIHNLPVPKAVTAVKAQVAEKSGVDQGLVIVLTAYEKDWSDSCLGLGGPAESCLFAITPGYEVSVQVKGVEQKYRTNADGSVIRREK